MRCPGKWRKFILVHTVNSVKVEDFLASLLPQFKHPFTLAYGVALAAPGSLKGKRRQRIRLGSILLRGNKVLSVGNNSYKTHPYLATKTPYPHLHAESHAILRHGLDNCHGATLYVFRLLNTGAIGMAAPCQVCRSVIQDAGIATIIYTTDTSFQIEALK